MNKKCCIIGIGGGGCKMLELLAESDLLCTLIAVNNEKGTLNFLDSCITNKIYVNKDQEALKGYLENPYNEENILDENIKNNLYELTKDCNEIAIVMTGGGVTGGTIAPIIAKYLKSLSKTVVAFTTLPFTFEGKKREKIARKTIENLEEICDQIEVIDNNKILKSLNKNDNMDDLNVKLSNIILRKIKNIF
ncbi:hypothetical protein [Nitratiruptor tergarcus]|uniref:Cell division GTPase n=1 Tax=Nitratiruptor tergarcus DSM 16512 TaxID=1069081 RepID=A0A1W1WV07_9BACT|nr:hypothetical protein [Nitratiruptor tergarcus]SMC10076.1 Cell division GTPase [Nitratiruptor tergarcus DSM 16512]